MKFFFFILILTFNLNAFAQKIVTPVQYTGLQWRVSGNTGFQPGSICTSLTLNGITDFANNSVVSLAGTLNCNNGAYTIVGGGYLNNVGGISIGLTVAGSAYWNCSTDKSLFGTCTVINVRTGLAEAAPTITFN